jgi:hypothetical protein
VEESRTRGAKRRSNGEHDEPGPPERSTNEADEPHLREQTPDDPLEEQFWADLRRVREADLGEIGIAMTFRPI